MKYLNQDTLKLVFILLMGLTVWLKARSVETLKTQNGLKDAGRQHSELIIPSGLTTEHEDNSLVWNKL